jgi:hypothetical protein
MGRRLVGGVLVACGLMAASLAWAGYAASRTVLDPGRSQAIADDLYRDREVRAQLRSSMASALGAALPDQVRVSRAELVAAADRALDDPAVEALLVGGLIRSHQRFLGADPRPDEPIVIDGSAIVSASRAALVNVRPDLINIPEPPSVPVTLPTDRLPNAGGFRTWLNGVVAMLAAVAVGLVVAAFVLTNSRPRVMRRVGFWAIGAAAFWLVVGFVLPQLAHLLIPGPSAILAAMWGVAAGGMLEPSRNALVAGVAAVIVSFIWAGLASILGGRSPAPAHEPPRPVRHPSSSPAPSPVAVAPARSPAPATTARPTRTPGPGTSPRGIPAVPERVAPAAATPMPPGVPNTGTPAPVATHRPAPPGVPTARPAPRWVEGVGYVDDDDPTQAV